MQEEERTLYRESHDGSPDNAGGIGGVGSSADFKTLTIRSSRGTVRGVKNRVRQGIATFLRDPTKKVMEKKSSFSICSARLTE